MSVPDSRHKVPARGVALEANLAALPGAAFVVDGDGVVAAWNADAESLFGILARDVVGQRLAELELSYRLPVVPVAFDDVALHPHRRVIDGARLSTRLGDSVLRLTVSPLTNETGGFAGVLVSVENCTEALTREAPAGAEGEDRARDSEHQRSAFMAMLAHELRNPLAPVLSALRVIAAHVRRDGTAQRALHVVERHVRHLARLLDDLLDVSRLTRGKIHVQREPVDLRAVVSEALDVCRPLTDAGRQRVTVSLPRSPMVVDGDQTRLVQVVSNLLDNAAKYTGPGGRIHVAAAAEGSTAVLRVEDNGMGIAPDMLPRVFDLFTQAESSLARSRGGLGLGLSLVRQIVELHGGEVAAESAGLGAGSRFVVRLPLADTPAAAAPAAAPTAPPAGRARILLIEDNRDAREMLHLALELDGHEVRTAWDGNSGLEVAREWAPAIAIVDIGLPGMDGYEVGHRLRAAWPSMFLVALTGYGDSDARRRIMEAGFDLHLVKPVDPEDVARVAAARAGRMDAA